MLTTEEILQDLFLIEFVEDRYKECTFVDQQQLIKWGKYFEENPYRGISSISNGNTYCLPLDNSLFEILDKYFLQNPVITGILEQSNDKIYVCGPRLLLSDGYDYGYFHFYFNSCTVEEAADLVVKSLKLLQNRDKDLGNVHDDRYFIRDNIITVVRVAGIENVNFHLTIFKDKAEMLKKIGPSIYQVGYNLKDKCFSTISGGITTAMGAFPIENNLKMENCDWVTNVGIAVLFPGYNNSIPPGHEIKVSNGEIVNDNDYIKIIETGDSPYVNSSILPQNIRLEDLLPKFCYYKNPDTRSTKLKGWILENYVPFIVGISDDRYVALSGIIGKFNLSKDVFKVLCCWWLKQESLDAKLRLLNL